VPFWAQGLRLLLLTSARVFVEAVPARRLAPYITTASRIRAGRTRVPSAARGTAMLATFSPL